MRVISGAILGLALLAHPAAALTINPVFDVSITGNANAASVQGAINAAIATIQSLYSDPGTVGIVFKQQNSGLGQSQSADYSISYTNYVAALTADAAAHPNNFYLISALAHLSSGNDANGAFNVLATSALFRVALGFNVTGCFNSAGTFVNTCGQAQDGVITISDGTNLGLNYGTSAVAGQYNAISVIEHEINEILGSAGQGSTLNAIQQGFTAYNNFRGPLDLYRYSAAGVASFTTSGSASSYFSVDGGVTSIVSFNQNSSGDYGDFGASGFVQSAFGSPGTAPAYTKASPEFAALTAVGYDPFVVPEPAGLLVLAGGALALAARRRRATSST